MLLQMLEEEFNFLINKKVCFAYQHVSLKIGVAGYSSVTFCLNIHFQFVKNYDLSYKF